MFLNPIDVPETNKHEDTDNDDDGDEEAEATLPDILLNLTPLRLRRGSLHTSISHCKMINLIEL